ncbi:hypothetical protein VP01_553g10 [Puccinia sorghi]|uniref:Uncharacterized protein n=1 Tax=Puccinia sorghi TaxID=27349 RepID=A0A0L6UJZ4_9BASI|nr:hypothetical protein VP01_553g10 [Puccinia sorghi]
MREFWGLDLEQKIVFVDESSFNLHSGKAFEYSL